MRPHHLLLLLGALLPSSLNASAAVPKDLNNPAQVGASRLEGGTRGSATIARAIRSGPVFGLAAIAAVTAARAARDPVPVFAPTELSNHAPIAANAATNILLNTAKTTANGTSMLPVVSPSYAAALNSATKAGLTSLSSGGHAPGSTSVQKLLSESLVYIGIPYRWGGTSPLTGLDCSGLTQLVYRNAVGVDLPRTAAEQAGTGTRVPVREIRKGDLVFFNTIGNNISHVGIYVGNGKFLHAPATGKLVRIDKLYTKFWAQRYVTARRVINDFQERDARFAAKVATAE